MNIAIFASAFYPHVGGVEELVRQLAHAYQDKGHEVLIITNRWPRDLPEAEDYEGIPVHRFPMRVPEGGVKAQTSYRLTHSSICRSMFNLLRERNIDVLHVQCISSNGYYALLAKRALGIPLVVTAQGELTMDAGHLYEKSAFANKVLRELMDEADYFTGCSQKTLDDIEAHTGRKFGTIASPVFNGANLADFNRAEPYQHPRPYILALGRMVPQKGFDIFLRALAQSGIASHDVILAGDGPERRPLEAMAAELGLSNIVHFIGSADRPKTASLFKGCSFFVMPSTADEGLPLVSVEAMAAGKALVATRAGGTGEAVIDGETGIIIPRGDLYALTGGIIRLVNDPALRTRMGAAGHERAKQFDWPNIAGEYLGIYRSVTCQLAAA